MVEPTRIAVAAQPKIDVKISVLVIAVYLTKIFHHLQKESLEKGENALFLIGKDPTQEIDDRGYATCGTDPLE